MLNYSCSQTCSSATLTKYDFPLVKQICYGENGMPECEGLKESRWKPVRKRKSRLYSLALLGKPMRVWFCFI